MNFGAAPNTLAPNSKAPLSDVVILRLSNGDTARLVACKHGKNCKSENQRSGFHHSLTSSERSHGPLFHCGCSALTGAIVPRFPLAQPLDLLDTPLAVRFFVGFE